MKALACNDIMPGCPATFSGETEDEILQQAGQHAVETHGLSVTPEIVETVRSQIRDAAEKSAQRHRKNRFTEREIPRFDSG